MCDACHGNLIHADDKCTNTWYRVQAAETRINCLLIMHYHRRKRWCNNVIYSYKTITQLENVMTITYLEL